MGIDTHLEDDSTGYLALFDTAPDRFAWRDPIPAEIEKRRVLLSDTLIFDILLANGGIRHASSLYPPTDVDSLQRLLEAICNSTYDTVKQDSLIYFLLKWHGDCREVDFGEARCIQPQFVALSDAYWHLDSGVNVGKAVSLLSDQRLNREYISKILQALSLSDNAHALTRKYVRTAQPLLTEPCDMDAYAIALADSSIMEAWQYQRTFSEKDESRPRLVRKILDWCLTPKPRLQQLKILVALHLTNYEQYLLHIYATGPPAKLPSASVSAIQDLACLRLVQAGEHAAAIKLDRQLSSSCPGAKERRQMMDDLMAAMPLAEQQLLEVELEKLTSGSGPRPSLNASQSWTSGIVSSSMDLSMSWESVRAPPVATSTAAASTVGTGAQRRSDVPRTAPPTTSQRSGAPRFGGPLGAAPQTEMFAPLSFPVGAPGALALSVFPPTISAGSGRPPLVSSTPQATTSNSAARPGSLFETAGSANQAPNAFYQPPPISAGAKRTLEQGAPRRVSVGPQRRAEPATAASTFPTSADGDVTMQTDEDAIAAELADVTQANTTHETDDDAGSPPTAFPTSVFSGVSGRRVSAPKLRAEKSDSPFFPGAFGPVTTDDEGELASMPPPPPPMAAATRKPRTSAARRRGSPSPLPTPARQTRATRSKTTFRDKGLGRSIPGGLMDEEEEEEEDAVPPLPPPTPATKKGTRKARASRGGDNDEVTMEDLKTRPRRSNRLSNAQSLGESSPEPASPTKPGTKTRSTRKSTVGTAKSSRKRR